MKIFIRLFLVSILILPSIVLAASFSDVSDDHPNKTAIGFLKQFGFVNGYSDGTFKPDDKVNRAEALKMILLAGEVDMTVEISEPVKKFSDVNEDVWFYSFVNAAVNKKIIDGYEDGTFKPGQSVILAEALKMIFQAYDIAELPVEFEAPYADVKSDLWFAPFAAFTASKNITLPEDDGLLHPEKEITRAELAELLYRFRYSANRNLAPVPFDLEWDSYEDSSLGFKTLMPPNWELINNPRSVLFWKKDPAFTNVHHGWLYPNSSTITFSSYENKEEFSKEDFFEQLKFSSTYTYNQVESVEMKINDFNVLKIKKVDSHEETYIFELPDKRFLVIFSDYGSGDYAPYLARSIEAVLNNIEYFTPSPPDKDAIKSSIFKAVLVEDKAEDLLDLIPDEKLIEADSLGVGTGPVDYYYSDLVEMTLKIERNSGILLDTRDGQTSAF